MTTCTKEYLDNLVNTYETPDFIKDDPVQFMHRFNKNPKDIEIAAFIAAMFAYGKREAFIAKLNILFERMNNKPYEFVMNFDENSTAVDDIDYRFSVGIDLKQILLILKELYKSGSSLEELFAHGWKEHKDIAGMLQVVVDYFYARVTLPVTKGFYHLLPDPSKKSACKRLNMFLRWMVRKSAVDYGIWHFMPTSELLIPLDVHVAKISRSLGLLKRKQNDYAAVKELTDKLKEFDPSDPVKYDFAMFGYGVTAAYSSSLSSSN